MPIKFLLLGGGSGLFLEGGGGSANFIFMGVGIFPIFLGLTEFRGANSVSCSRPIICVPKRTRRL